MQRAGRDESGKKKRGRERGLSGIMEERHLSVCGSTHEKEGKREREGKGKEERWVHGGERRVT